MKSTLQEVCDEKVFAEREQIGNLWYNQGLRHGIYLGIHIHKNDTETFKILCSLTGGCALTREEKLRIILSCLRHEKLEVFKVIISNYQDIRDDGDYLLNKILLSIWYKRDFDDGGNIRLLDVPYLDSIKEAYSAQGFKLEIDFNKLSVKIKITP